MCPVLSRAGLLEDSMKAEDVYLPTNLQDSLPRCSGVSPEDKNRKCHQGVDEQGPDWHEIHKICESEE